MAERKVSTASKAEAAKQAKDSENKRAEKAAEKVEEKEVKASETSEAEPSDEAKEASEEGADAGAADGDDAFVDGPSLTKEEVLEDTGPAAEQQAEAIEKAKSEGEIPLAEASDSKSEAAKELEKEDPKERGAVSSEEAPADGPFSNAAVAGATEKTFGQKAQLYTDGLGGNADHDLGRAY